MLQLCSSERGNFSRCHSTAVQRGNFDFSRRHSAVQRWGFFHFCWLFSVQPWCLEDMDAYPVDFGKNCGVLAFSTTHGRVWWTMLRTFCAMSLAGSWMWLSIRRLQLHGPIHVRTHPFHYTHAHHPHYKPASQNVVCSGAFSGREEFEGPTSKYVLHLCRAPTFRIMAFFLS